MRSTGHYWEAALRVAVPHRCDPHCAQRHDGRQIWHKEIYQSSAFCRGQCGFFRRRTSWHPSIYQHHGTLAAAMAAQPIKNVSHALESCPHWQRPRVHGYAGDGPGSECCWLRAWDCCADVSSHKAGSNPPVERGVLQLVRHHAAELAKVCRHRFLCSHLCRRRHARPKTGKACTTRPQLWYC